MLKIIKKILLILAIMLMEISIFIYRIFSKFWKRYNNDIKGIARDLDNELRRSLNNTWQINLSMER